MRYQPIARIICFALVLFIPAKLTAEPSAEDSSATYYISCVTGRHLEETGETLQALESYLERLTALEVEVLVLLDPLPEAEEADYLALQSLLAQYPITTFLVGSQGHQLEQSLPDILTPIPGMAHYGPDGFQFLGEAENHGGEVLDNTSGEFHLQRRALKASRWTIGFTPSISPAMPIRNQLSLFVDDSLDYLIAGAVHGIEVPEGAFGTMPWGATEFGLAPTLDSATPMVLQVDAQRLLPMSLEQLQALRNAAAEADAAATAEDATQEETEGATEETSDDTPIASGDAESTDNGREDSKTETEAETAP